MRRTVRMRMAGIAAVTAALAMASATPAGAASLGGGDDMGFPDYDWANDDSSIVGRFPGARGLGDLDALNIHAVPEAVAVGDPVPGRSSLQQVVGSEQVARLRALPDTQPGVRYAVIVSDDDTTVTPPRAGFLEAGPGATVDNVAVQDVCPGAPRIDHVGIPDHAIGADLVADAFAGRTIACG